MAFSMNPVDTVEITDTQELERYMSDEEQRIAYKPISEYLSDGGQFYMDQVVGRRKNTLEFNEDGFKAFCSVFQIPIDFIMELHQPNLVSQVLNDRLSRRDMIERINKYKFVVDLNDQQILGVVSNTYVPYSNHQFYNDLMSILEFQHSDFTLSSCYIENTNFDMRLMSDIEAGLIHGRGGTDVDRFTVGIQLSNSMVGESFIKASFFVHRLICANGLVIQSQGEIGKVKHSGSQESFMKRISQRIIPIFEQLHSVPDMIHSLGNIPFDLDLLVRQGGAKSVYDIIPLPYWEAFRRSKLKGTELLSYDERKITEYIERYAGPLSRKVFYSNWRNNQSMFDFVNIFTEYAKTLRARERVTVEEKSGDLVKWVLANQEKLNLGSSSDAIYFLNYY